jgi:hypothetical protein
MRTRAGAGRGNAGRGAAGNQVLLLESCAGPQWTLLAFGEDLGELVRAINDRRPGTVCAVAVPGSESGPDILSPMSMGTRGTPIP